MWGGVFDGFYFYFLLAICRLFYYDQCKQLREQNVEMGIEWSEYNTLIHLPIYIYIIYVNVYMYKIDIV